MHDKSRGRKAESGKGGTGSPGAVARSLGIGLLAVAAITASVFVGRSRLADRAPEDPVPNGGETAPPPGVELDAIRAAGL